VAGGILALAGEAEGRSQGTARQAPGVVPLRGKRVARVVQRAPRAAQRVSTVPRADAVVKLEQAALAVRVVAVDWIVVVGAPEQLRHRCCEIPDEPGVGVVDIRVRTERYPLRHAQPVAVIARLERVGGGGDKPVQAVVGVLARLVGCEQVARLVVAPADHAVGGVVAAQLHQAAVQARLQAVAHEVVGVGVGVAGALGGTDQALQAVVAVSEA